MKREYSEKHVEALRKVFSQLAKEKIESWAEGEVRFEDSGVKLTYGSVYMDRVVEHSHNKLFQLTIDISDIRGNYEFRYYFSGMGFSVENSGGIPWKVSMFKTSPEEIASKFGKSSWWLMAAVQEAIQEKGDLAMIKSSVGRM